MALHAAIGGRRGELAGVVETVPSMRSLMVCYDPLATSRAELAARDRGPDRPRPADRHEDPAGHDPLLLRRPRVRARPRGGRRAHQEDGRAGDRRSTSRRASRSTCWASCRAWPTSPAWSRSLYLPRRSQPRVRVPRSTVAIAMDMTTIYPFESPGGWHLIGRTPLWMFDQRREQPVFLAPGDSLTFQRIDRKTYDRVAREVEAGTFDWADAGALMSAALKVVRAGPVRHAAGSRPHRLHGARHADRGRHGPRRAPPRQRACRQSREHGGAGDRRHGPRPAGRGRQRARRAGRSACRRR